MSLPFRRLAQLGVTAAMTAALALTTGSHAHAAAYDGADPASTYCGGTTSTVSTATITYRDGTRVGTVSLRYNSGCRTTWAKVVLDEPQIPCGSVQAGNSCAVGWVHRNSDGAEEYCTIPTGGTSCYTAMLNDANVTSYASAEFDGGRLATGTTRSY